MWTNIILNMYKMFLIRGTLIVNKLCRLYRYGMF